MLTDSIKSPPAQPRICLTQPAVVAAWCRELKCTESQLRSAVYAVGSQPYWVRKFFRPVSDD